MLHRAHLVLALALSSTAAFAQQAPPPPGAHANSVREVTAIQRNTGTITNVGEFHDDTPRPRPTTPQPGGEVAASGTVTERHLDQQLRGSSGPAPGEIDMTRPIGAADVARIVRAYEPRFRPCYDRARATRPTLAGRVNMRFVVSRTGALTDVDVSGLAEAPEVATCIRDELRQTTFPRPEAGTLPFATGMNFAPPAPPPRPARGGRRPRR
jgi:hypothetical protein